MSQVNTLVITGYGTNSHQETAHAARLAGADRADVVHFSDIVAAKVRLSEYQFLVSPADPLMATISGRHRPRHSAGCIFPTRKASLCWTA